MHRFVPQSMVVALLGVAVSASLAHGQQIPVHRTARASARPETHPLDPALDMAQASLQHIQTNVNDYTALFVKRNRIRGQLKNFTYANVKIRHRREKDGQLEVPMSVYLDFLKPADVKGREVIWVENQNDGKLIVHETGLRNVINVKLDPTGRLAMKDQRYPITEIGMEKLAEKLIETATRHRQFGECDVKFYKEAKIGDHPCWMFEVIHPVKRDHFDFYRAQVFFSHELKMPVRYVSWSWPVEPGDEDGVLEEEYTYLNVEVNVGLTDHDFDVDNPNYRFW